MLRYKCMIVAHLVNSNDGWQWVRDYIVLRYYVVCEHVTIYHILRFGLHPYTRCISCTLYKFSVFSVLIGSILHSVS